MGDDAVGGDASPEQIEKMAALLGGALTDGARGIVDFAVEHPQRRRGQAGPVAQCVARGIA